VPSVNALFCPLKTEEETLGVVVATNRAGGFGHEEADAVTSFADAASLLIRNGALYTTLMGTVEELRLASRLKDQSSRTSPRAADAADVDRGVDGPPGGGDRRRGGRSAAG